MEYNQPSQIVKDLNFGDDGKNRIISGVDKLATAVKSTLGASGRCVIYEDAMGKPVITKDGVTVAESVVLYDPVENIGATLIKEAAKNTVKEAGDGTTTATVLAQSLLHEMLNSDLTQRQIKEGIESACDKVVKFLQKHAKNVSGKMLNNVASISCNNDKELGSIIADAYNKVGKDGVVLFEDSQTEKTYADVVDGVQINSALQSNYLITDKDRELSELDNPYILISYSPIRTIRSIQNILEYVIKQKRPLVIVGKVEDSPKSALIANHVKGNIKLNIIDEIIPEPLGGAHRDSEQIAIEIKKSILKNLEEFENLSGNQIFEQRKNRFLKIGRDQGFKKSSERESISGLSYIEPGFNKVIRFFKKNKNISLIGLGALVLASILYFLV